MRQALPAHFPERERKVLSWPVVTWLLSAGAWFGQHRCPNANIVSPTPPFMFKKDIYLVEKALPVSAGLVLREALWHQKA